MKPIPLTTDQIKLFRLPLRQQTVLQFVAESMTVKEIALKLHLSPKTVEYHRANLSRNLGIPDVAGMTRFAIRAGLISP